MGAVPLTFVVLASVAIGLGLVVWYVRRLFKGPDYSRLPAAYPFKSEAARRRYHEYYGRRVLSWPAPAETRHLQTAFGKTLVRICGPESAPALVLLPSGFASSLIWLPNIEGLAEHFRIYAVDNIYDVGLSVNTRPVKDAGHLTDWLDELFEKLGLTDGVRLLGLSFGGWLAARYALGHPDKLQQVVLAAPAATIFPLPGAWAWRGVMGALPPHRFFMSHFLVNWMCRDLARQTDAHSRLMLDNWLSDALMAMRCFTFRMPIAPTVLSDEELGGLRPQTLFVVGEHEVIYPATEAVRRIKRVAPSITTAVIRNASHDLTISQTRAFNRLVVAFLLGKPLEGYPAQDNVLQ